jgi:hypothetical protein
VPLAAILLVLTSSVFHVAWNAIVKTSGDPLATATRAVGLGVLVLTPLVAVAWLASGLPGLPAEAWLIALVSGVISAAYFVPLSAAYRHGALSSVYPVARGTGALLNAVHRIEQQRKAVQIVGATPIVRALLLLIGISPRHFVKKAD